MEQPFVGKKADVCNKKACIALAKMQEEEAMEQWNQAIAMKDSHFDSHVNLLLYKWRTGLISDEQVIG